MTNKLIEAALAECEAAIDGPFRLEKIGSWKWQVVSVSGITIVNVYREATAKAIVTAMNSHKAALELADEVALMEEADRDFRTYRGWKFPLFDKLKVYLATLENKA